MHLPKYNMVGGRLAVYSMCQSSRKQKSWLFPHDTGLGLYIAYIFVAPSAESSGRRPVAVTQPLISLRWTRRPCCCCLRWSSSSSGTLSFCQRCRLLRRRSSSGYRCSCCFSSSPFLSSQLIVVGNPPAKLTSRLILQAHDDQT